MIVVLWLLLLGGDPSKFVTVYDAGAEMGVHVECPATATSLRMWILDKTWVALQDIPCDCAYLSIPGDPTLRVRFDVAKFYYSSVPEGGSRMFAFTALNDAGESAPSLPIELVYAGGVTVLP